MALFQPILFVFKPDFDHGMMACHDMFDMFSLTCLACDMGRGTVFQSTFFIVKPDFDRAHSRSIPPKIVHPAAQMCTPGDTD